MIDWQDYAVGLIRAAARRRGGDYINGTWTLSTFLGIPCPRCHQRMALAFPSAAGGRIECKHEGCGWDCAST